MQPERNRSGVERPDAICVRNVGTRIGRVELVEGNSEGFLRRGSDQGDWDNIFYVNDEFTRHMAHNTKVFADMDRFHHMETYEDRPLRTC
jgi:hypothetical protein